MNERIRQIMLDSGYAAPELAGRANKLVELILFECIKLMYGRDENGNCKDGDVIKQHFGVEE